MEMDGGIFCGGTSEENLEMRQYFDTLPSYVQTTMINQIPDFHGKLPGISVLGCDQHFRAFFAAFLQDFIQPLLRRRRWGGFDAGLYEPGEPGQNPGNRLHLVLFPLPAGPSPTVSSR